MALLLLGAARARFDAPAPTLLLRDLHGSFLGEVGNGPHAPLGFWPLAELPSRVVAATVAIEDRRFWRHGGVDLLAVVRAAAHNLAAGRRVSGASTLAMQVARLQRPGRRTLARKAVEAVTAVLLTARYGRRAVLAQYLTLAPYGGRVHGIAFAARRYFDKPVEDLSWAEIAFLTAIPQAPTAYNPHKAGAQPRLRARAERILALLHARGVLSQWEWEQARRELVALRVPAAYRRPLAAMHAVLRLEGELGSPDARRRRAARPIVTTTLDLALQERVVGALGKAVQRDAVVGVENGAVVVVALPAREVRAWAGSSGWNDARTCGAIDYTRVLRSPGSALKPFLYALAYEINAITPATVLDDLHPAPGGIGNADARFLGPLLPRVALANSRNVPAVQLLRRVGLDEARTFLADLQLGESGRSAGELGLGLAVGGMPVTLEQLVRAAAVLAVDGRLAPLRWLADDPPEAGRRLLSESTTQLVTLQLADPLARLPSFPRQGASEYPFPVAVKTGTSPQQRDAWALAWSHDELVGVWLGRADHRPMPGATGFAQAARLAREVLLALHPEQAQGLADLSFPPPPGFLPVQLCGLTGERASPRCHKVFLEWMRPTDVPRAQCTAHVEVAVDVRTGAPAGLATPPALVAHRTFDVLSPRYADWAKRSGLPKPPSLPGVWWTPADGRPLGGGRVRITFPDSGVCLLTDPETPFGLHTLALRAEVEPRVPQLLWLINGQPWQLADYPYTVRWPVAAGAHTFVAQIPFSRQRSAPVTVYVR